jgi:hypothetical protein
MTIQSKIDLRPAKLALGEQRVTIPYKPRGVFKAYHKREQRFALTVAHRRCGKTVAEVNEGGRRVLMNPREFPPPQVAFISPTFGQSKRNAWPYARHYFSHIPGIKFSEAELIVTFPNKGKFYFAGSDNPDALRGLYLDHASLDEYGDQDPRVWGEVVRPQLSDYGGTATFIGSARGRNHFFELMTQHQDDEDWLIQILKASETGLISDKELALARSAMTEDEYAQEYECSFDAAIKGSYYGGLIEAAESEGRIGHVVYYDESAPVYSCWDLGIGDHTAIWTFQVIGPEYHWLSYYENTGENLGHYCDYLDTLPYKIVEDFVPHDAEARELQTGYSRTQFLRNRKRNPTVVPRHNPDDGIMAVRKQFNGFYFNKEFTRHGVDCIRMYRARFDEKNKVGNRKPLHDWSSHAADAMRCGIMGIGMGLTASDWAKPLHRNIQGIV